MRGWQPALAGIKDEQTLQPDEQTTVRVHTLIEEKSVPTGT
jgi:hypothetical protein